MMKDKNELISAWCDQSANMNTELQTLENEMRIAKHNREEEVTRLHASYQNICENISETNMNITCEHPETEWWSWWKQKKNSNL